MQRSEVSTKHDQTEKIRHVHSCNEITELDRKPGADNTKFCIYNICRVVRIVKEKLLEFTE